MKRPSLKFILISIFVLYVVVKCGSGIIKDIDNKTQDKSDNKIALSSRIPTEGVENESIINSTNPIFIYNSYVKAIRIYKSEQSEQSEDKVENSNAEAINENLSSTEMVSLLTPFIFLFCIVAIIININKFRWERFCGPYFNKYLK